MTEPTVAEPMAPEQIADVLRDHQAWLAGQGGKRADLGDATMPAGYKWEAYLTEVVPALLTAGGKALAEVATPEVWDCHSWRDGGISCPVGTAFGVERLEDVPPLHWYEAGQLVEFFDQGLIPLPVVVARGGAPPEEKAR